MDMLPLIEVVPEYNLTLDPSTGMIGASLGREVLILSMDDIENEITELEDVADDLMNSLDPNTTALGSYPRREGVYLTSGIITNVIYGVLIGLVMFIAAVPLLINWGVL
jgi:tetrahydromethanopterin S-methyltransferase subunit B